MGQLIDGQWSTEGYRADNKGGFLRDPTLFRGHVSTDGSTPFQPEAGRYHLYVSLACPWAHRTLIMRQLKGLDRVISVSVVHPIMGENGWEFADAPGATPDTVNGARFLYEIYTKAKADYSGRVTVPVLWDRKLGTIVNNESREILRMFDHEFSKLARISHDFCPPELEAAIDAELDAMYPTINNGVYRAGFARSQEAYEQAVTDLFSALDTYEALLSKQRYLVGNELTEADVCLFTTLVRFDAVYHYHFKCNVRKIADYPQLSNYLRDIYQLPGIAPLCNFEHIKQHYYRSHPHVNPTGIVPVGPDLNLQAPHDRNRFTGVTRVTESYLPPRAR